MSKSSPARGASRINTSAVSAVVVGMAAASVHAQPATAQITWQVSRNHVNWYDDMTIAENENVNRVHVRALLTYPAPLDYLTRFGLSRCDPTVIGRSGAGAGDTIEGIHYRQDYLLRPSYNEYVASRVGAVLKIDAVGDTAPPGLGTGWVVSSQMSPAFGQLTDDLPVIVIYQYTLVLDGTPGVRDIGGAFRQLVSGIPSSFVGVWAPVATQGWTMYGIPTTINDGIVRVNVPTPSFAGVLVAAGLVACRRRRS
jgi:hypothetical protein